MSAPSEMFRKTYGPIGLPMAFDELNLKYIKPKSRISCRVTDDDIRNALKQYKATTGKWPFNKKEMDAFANSWKEFMPDSVFARISWDNVFHGTAEMADVVIGSYGGSRQFAALVRSGAINRISEECGVLCIFHDQRKHIITISALSCVNIASAFKELHKELIAQGQIANPLPIRTYNKRFS